MLSPNTPNGHQAQRCSACGKPLVCNLVGRRKTYCSDACRLEGHRTRQISFLGHSKGLQRNGASTPCGIAISGADFCDRGPVNILGGHRWPNAKPLDSKTLAKVVRAELGALP
jgi:hypothetical protein